MSARRPVRWTMAEGVIGNTWPLVMPDFRVRFHADRPKWEIGRLRSCAELMRPGMVVVDAGAEHGDFTALYRTWVGEAGDVIPVEPAAHYWPFIRRTLEANGFKRPPALAFEGFAGAESRGLGDRTLYRGAWPRSASGPGLPDGGFRHLAQHDHIPSIRLDELPRYGVVPDAIVSDVEGAEWHLLDGARGLLATVRPILWVSVHEPTMAEWYDRTLDDLLALTGEYGYRARELPQHGEIETFWLFEPEEA